jgi:hypothetical protein
MKFSTLSAVKGLLIIMFAFVLMNSTAEARNCKKGKPCGNSCIAKADVCHKDAGTATAAPAVAPAPAAAAPAAQAVATPAAPAAAPAPAESAKVCTKGKACGNSCIAKDAVCHQ